MRIEMVDLKGQLSKFRIEIEKVISSSFSSAIFIQGNEVFEFEHNFKNFISSNNCLTCANGTDALQIAMMALDLRPGDEIIIPSFTYIATVEAAALLKIKPVLVDSDPNTFNVSPTEVEKAITNKTKAIVPVHLYGQCADMNSLMAIAQNTRLYLIEDTAQAIASQYTFSNGSSKFAGTIGTIGTTSFFPSKNLGCYGDGGALFTQNEELAKKIRMICNHGQEKKYYHDLVGVNSRLDTLQAAILNLKLKYLNEYTSARQKAAAYYDKAFSGNPWFEIPFRDPQSSHVFHQYTIKLKDKRRDKLKRFLESKGIPSMIYYPVPAHLQKGYSYLGYKKGDLPVAEMLSESVLSLPMHTELTEEQLNYIVENVLNFFK